MKFLNKYCKQQALKCLAGIIVALSPAPAFAQADIHFSQFYETSILRNPALTGVFADDYKVGVYYRNQWSSITNPYSTVMAGGETHFSINPSSEDFLSIGLTGYYDKAGSIDQKITAFYPAINYNKSLNVDHNRFLSFGFTGGYNQYSFDPNKATFNNQYQNGKYNPLNPSMENLPRASMSLWDLGAGINFNTSVGETRAITYIIGISGYHFTQPKFSYYQKVGITQNMRLNGNASVLSSINENVTLNVHANYAMQGQYREIMLGGILNWTQKALGPQEIFILSGGLYYRYKDALIPVFKVNYKGLALGISYDVNVSTLKEASRMQGGYEFTLYYTGNFTDKGIQKKTVCPKY